MPYFDEPGVRFDDPLIRFDDPRTYQEILASLNPTPKKMFKVILDLEDTNVPELIQRARQIAMAVSGQAIYSTLSARVTAIEGKADALETKHGEVAETKSLLSTQVAQQETTARELTGLLQDLGLKVGELAVTEADVEAALMRVREAPAPRPVPAQVTGLELTYGDEEGELTAAWDGQPKIADFFEARYTLQDPAGLNVTWVPLPVAKKSRKDFQGLPTGVKVWIQVRASNSRGEGLWSDPACKRVP